MELHNSCQAIDEFIKSILDSQDETLARRALDQYQTYYSTLERPWEHENFMYGLGLIYMHFNAYHWAVKLFRDIVYVRPSFPKSRDVHTRLGLIFKSTSRYELSERHFNLAIHDTRQDSGTSTKLELRFHLAHLAELRGSTKQAIELYEKLLQDKDLPQKLSANIQRQLGWIHYSAATTSSDANSHLNPHHPHPHCQQHLHYHHHHNMQDILNQNSLLLTEPTKLDSALNYLNTSYKTDSDSQTSYYLGRCLTNVGKFQDAFAYYRSVIDKEESTADTWCSIGVLYQRRNQPWDALQAYIRSVQYDKKHAVAWMNLGILYESHNQFKDAIKCYQHVLRSNSSSHRNHKSLQTRINYIQKHLDDIEISSSNSGKPCNNSDKLLSLEDLWNMESKTNQDSYSSTNASNSNKSDLLIIQSAPPSSQQQQQQQHKNKNNNNNDTSNNHNNHHNNQPKQAIEPSRPIEANCNTNQESRSLVQNDMTTHSIVDALKPCNGQPQDPINDHSSSILPTDCKKEKIEVMETEATSEKTTEMNSIHPKDTANNLNGLKPNTNDCKVNILSSTIAHGNQDLKPQLLESKDFCSNQLLTNGASKDSGISSDSSTYTDCALVPSHISDVSIPSYMSAEQVLLACKNSTKLKKIDINLLSDDIKPPSPYPKPPTYPPLSTSKLFPVPPNVFLDSKKELTTKHIQEICQSNPISIVRNIASVLKLDLGLFSTKTLVEINPDQQIDIVSHLYMNNEEGTKMESDQTNSPWACERHLSSSTISRYASYQVASFRQSLQDERDSKSKNQVSTKESETDSNESAAFKKNQDGGGPSSFKSAEAHGSTSKSSGSASKRMKKEDEPRIKFVKSANMIDLSDDKKWRSQLNELNKLPHFMKCVSASNMLTHIGLAVPGLNTISMSMHVPGCKMVGHKTPNHFCSVNINTGPGDYEWCAIPGEYERALKKLCNRNGHDINKKDWWPRLSDLHKYRIPVYRFSQRPGDLVWINSGTLYWVQAVGWANSIQWNLGPLCARQYQLASESYEMNKLLFKRSEVPLIQMTWNIIINIGFIADDELSWSITSVLRRSLCYCKQVRDIIKESKCAVEMSEEDPGPRSAKYCSLCESEIFNIAFRRAQDEAIYCVECARRATNGTFEDYKAYQEYDIRYLARLYDNFIDTRKKYQSRQALIKQESSQEASKR